MGNFMGKPSPGMLGISLNPPTGLLLNLLEFCLRGSLWNTVTSHPWESQQNFLEKPLLGVLLKLAENPPAGTPESHREPSWNMSLVGIHLRRCCWNLLGASTTGFLAYVLNRSKKRRKGIPSFLSVPPIHFPNHSLRMIILKHSMIISLPKTLQ